MLLQSWLSVVEKSAVAQAIAGPPMAWLSALHAVAFTVLMGSALVANLRAGGVLFVDAPLLTVIKPTTRVIAWAAIASAVTGLALAAPRAVATAHHVTFVVKLSCASAAMLAQWSLAVLAKRHAGTRAIRAVGILAGSCWVAAGVAACLFILVE